MELRAGSIFPERVPIVTPASGVKPIDVSIDFPPSIAAILAPLPSDKKLNVIVQLVAKFLLHAVKHIYVMYRGNHIYECHIFHNIHMVSYIDKNFSALFDGMLYQILQLQEHLEELFGML